MADDITIATINTFVEDHNGDLSIRCGSLDPEANPPQQRRYTGEVAGSFGDFTFDQPTLAGALDEIVTQMSNIAARLAGEHVR